MEPNNTQPVQQMPPVTPPVQPAPQPININQMQSEHKPLGPIIGVIIIIILLIVAAVYVWGQKLNNDEKKAPIAPVSQSQIKTQPVVAQEQKDDFTDMEANLNASVEGLDDSNF